MIGGIDQLATKVFSSLKGKEAMTSAAAAAGSLASASHLGAMRKEISQQRALLQQIGTWINSQISSIKELNTSVNSQLTISKEISTSLKSSLGVLGKIESKVSAGGGAPGAGGSDKSSVEIQKLAMKMTSQSAAQVNATKGIGNNIKELSSGITSVMTKIEEEARRREEERAADAEKKKPGFFKNASTQIKSGVKSTKDSLGILTFIIPVVAALANALKERIQGIVKYFTDTFKDGTLSGLANIASDLYDIFQENVFNPVKNFGRELVDAFYDVDFEYIATELSNTLERWFNGFVEFLRSIPGIGKFIDKISPNYSVEASKTEQKIGKEGMEKAKKEGKEFFESITDEQDKEIAQRESSGGTNLVSSVSGARGMFQITPGTLETAQKQTSIMTDLGLTEDEKKKVQGMKADDLVTDHHHGYLVHKINQEFNKRELARILKKDPSKITKEETALAHQLGAFGASKLLEARDAKIKINGEEKKGGEVVVNADGTIGDNEWFLSNLSVFGDAEQSKQAMENHKTQWSGKTVDGIIEEITSKTTNKNSLVSTTEQNRNSIAAMRSNSGAKLANGNESATPQIAPEKTPQSRTERLQQNNASLQQSTAIAVEAAKNLAPPPAPMVLAPQQVTNAPVSSNSSVVNYFGETESAISKWCNIINASHSYA